VTLPWGLAIKVNPHEALGSNIARHGLYEMAVTEALWRLSDPGDLAVDAGANIGYTAAILGVRVGPTGQVICFEPHPQVFASLRENVDTWERSERCGVFVLHQAALGREDGRAFLHTNAWFYTNRGTARISTNAMQAGPDVKVFEVPIRSLDSLLSDTQTIGVLKIDVEGSGLDVLFGMTHLLRRGAVRDIVFEEEGEFPAPSHAFLKASGYSIFGLEEHFFGVRCIPDSRPASHPVFGPVPNYLATLAPARTKARFRSPMWRSFGILRSLAHHIF
jgi:FkbM family methyltransferase